MLKRKRDNAYEIKRKFFLGQSTQVEFRKLIPIAYEGLNSDGEPPENPNIDFQYLDEWLVHFPACLLDDVVFLILEFLCLYDIMKQRRSLILDYICSICGMMDEAKKGKLFILCSRCCSYFCEYCWVETGLIPDSHDRMLKTRMHNDEFKDTIRTKFHVHYSYCPCCCAGLEMFRETE